nr:ferritin 1 [Limnephilus flavicornis]
MKLFIVFAAVLAVSSANYCYNDVTNACGPSESSSDLANCNAQFSAFRGVSSDLHAYANSHIMQSYEYLLMATHFGNYQQNRDGFAKLFRKLSDDTWAKSIDLIKYITKRGGRMDFNARKPIADKEPVADNKKSVDRTYELNELGSMAKALDQQKVLADEAHKIHGEVTRRSTLYHDPQVGHYLEEEFMNQQADTIRTLAGHTNDLKRLIKEQPNDKSLALFLFDEYLSKLG